MSYQKELQEHRDYMASQFATITIDQVEKDWLYHLIPERLYATEAFLVEKARNELTPTIPQAGS